MCCRVPGDRRVRGAAGGRPVGGAGGGGVIYVGMLPFSVRSFRRLKREAEAMRVPRTRRRAADWTVHERW